MNDAIVTDLGVLVRTRRKYGVIYADPPWLYNSGKGSRSLDRFYDCLDIPALKQLPVKQLAADNSVLIMWAVWPLLPNALEVIQAWGFEYKTVAFVWVKTTDERAASPLAWGMGWWTRSNSEPCLLATRGQPVRIDKGVHQIIMTPVGSHSRKPQEVHARIERLVDGPYLELFGRRPMRGWTVFGNQISSDLFTRDIPEILHVDSEQQQPLGGNGAGGA